MEKWRHYKCSSLNSLTFPIHFWFDQKFTRTLFKILQGQAAAHALLSSHLASCRPSVLHCFSALELRFRLNSIAWNGSVLPPNPTVFAMHLAYYCRLLKPLWKQIYWDADKFIYHKVGVNASYSCSDCCQVLPLVSHAVLWTIGAACLSVCHLLCWSHPDPVPPFYSKTIA